MLLRQHGEEVEMELPCRLVSGRRGATVIVGDVASERTEMEGVEVRVGKDGGMLCYEARLKHRQRITRTFGKFWTPGHSQLLYHESPARDDDGS